MAILIVVLADPVYIDTTVRNQREANMAENYHRLFRQAQGRRHDNPQAAVQGMKNAIAKAREAGDDRALLEFNHWLLQTLIFKTRDIKQALPLAMETAVEARKDKYKDMQEHICVYQDLILTYLDTDPVGHETVIEEALDYMQAEVADQQIQCRTCLQGLRSDFEFARADGDYTRAVEEANRQISVAEGFFWSRAHHQSFAYALLARIAYEREDWDAMMDAAHTAVEISGSKRDVLTNACIANLALAIGYYQRDQHEDADRHFQKATFDARSTSALMPPDYYDLLRAYHERRGADDLALLVTDTELAEIEDLGLLYREARVNVVRCELLARLGKLTTNDRDRATVAIEQLKAPAKLHDRLAAIQR
ncbi:MAG: hypothetical protein AAF125_11570 [Chloroflexota bacterium]